MISQENFKLLKNKVRFITFKRILSNYMLLHLFFSEKKKSNWLFFIILKKLLIFFIFLQKNNWFFFGHFSKKKNKFFCFVACECVVYQSLGNTEGRFQSPNFPRRYSQGIECILFTFIGDVGEIVEIKFTELDMMHNGSQG